MSGFVGRNIYIYIFYIFLISLNRIWQQFGVGLFQFYSIAFYVYSQTPFERPPWWEATPSGKATWQCKFKLKCIDFYPWWEATPFERPLFWCKRSCLTRGVPQYVVYYFDATLSVNPSYIYIFIKRINSSLPYYG